MKFFGDRSPRPDRSENIPDAEQITSTCERQNKLIRAHFSAIVAAIENAKRAGKNELDLRTVNEELRSFFDSIPAEPPLFRFDVSLDGEWKMNHDYFQGKYIRFNNGQLFWNDIMPRTLE
jgi:hypothetical protein